MTLATATQTQDELEELCTTCSHRMGVHGDHYDKENRFERFCTHQVVDIEGGLVERCDCKNFTKGN